MALFVLDVYAICKDSRHLAEWRLSLFAILIVTVKLNGWNVIVIGTRFTPFRVV